MKLLAQRTAIVAALEDALPKTVDCNSHGGRFSVDDLKRIAQRTPAVRVGCLAIRDMVSDNAGGIDITVVWGVFVITTDTPQFSRDAAALILVAAIAALVPDNRWAAIASDNPAAARGDNLYSGQLENVGVALWAITWQQQLTLDKQDLANLDAFQTLHVDFNLAPKDDSIDGQTDIDLPQ